jgi:hypothetical protein
MQKVIGHSHCDDNKLFQGFTILSYWCSPENICYDLHDRYRLEWKDAREWHEDKAFDLPSPEGMSGGPLWRFRSPVTNSIWSPARIGQIIGIQSAWDTRDAAFIEPADRWWDWFHTSLLTIDQHFNCDKG